MNYIKSEKYQTPDLMKKRRQGDGSLVSFSPGEFITLIADKLTLENLQAK